MEDYTSILVAPGLPKTEEFLLTSWGVMSTTYHEIIHIIEVRHFQLLGSIPWKLSLCGKLRDQDKFWPSIVNTTWVIRVYLCFESSNLVHRLRILMCAHFSVCPRNIIHGGNTIFIHLDIVELVQNILWRTRP